VTLNSHLPTSSLVGAGCPEPFSSAETCSHYRELVSIHTAIVQLMMRDDLPATEFIIVGDHSPPFMRDTERALYSQLEVPAVRLVPRDAGTWRSRKP
jgi:hypothetical protein